MPDPKPVQGIQFKNQLWDNIGYKVFLEMFRLSFVIFCMVWKYISSSLFWQKFVPSLGFQMGPVLDMAFQEVALHHTKFLEVQEA